MRANINGDGNIVAKGDVNIFSDEWVAQNAWMKEANEAEAKKVQKAQSVSERYNASLPCFVNFPQGIPIPKIVKEGARISSYLEDQASRLKIFHEMLGEKGIRAGRNGVGEPHRGWGNGRQKN